MPNKSAAPLAGAALFLFTGCIGHSARVLPMPVSNAELPPHVVEVATGLYSCEQGYLIRQGRCIAFANLPTGPIVEISNLPSAGDGAPTTCPSGGCSFYVAPMYWVSYPAPVYGSFDGGRWNHAHYHFRRRSSGPSSVRSGLHGAVFRGRSVMRPTWRRGWSRSQSPIRPISPSTLESLPLVTFSSGT